VTVAVIAHSGKTLGGGLAELRYALAREGVVNPIWHEMPKSKAAPKRVRHALAAGADVIVAWGGDGMMLRCIDVIAGTNATLVIVPAGTANLLAHNLGIPVDVGEAVAVGFRGARRRIDVGRVNGEAFAVMTGAGFDARMIGDADGNLKDTLGRVAYVWTGARNIRAEPFDARIRVDGRTWHRGKTSCILLGNVGRLFAGLEAFQDARPDDGVLELGVVTADGLVEWLRTLARTAGGKPDASPFIRTTKARSVEVKLNRKIPYELDGGARGKTKRLRVELVPNALTVAVPADPDRPGAPQRGSIAAASRPAAPTFSTTT
jgi:diacylglycerol kinase (ATP)